MPWVNLNELPEFKAAAIRVQTNREEFFLGLERKICGFPVRVMTVQDFIILDRKNSPFVHRRIPTAVELTHFISLLSPDFNKWISDGWRASNLALPLMRCERFLFGRRVAKAFGKPPSEKWEKSTMECFEYVNEIFEDAPGGDGKSREQFVSFEDLWLDLLRSQYGFVTKEYFLSMGLPDVFAAIRAIQMRENPKLSFSSKRTGELTSRLLQGLTDGTYKMEDLTTGRIKLT